jgi:hypothetical protein
MQITRYASLTEQQFLGCTSAFVDVLSGELNSAVMYLRKLENQPKGAAFAYEMTLDRHRYGALTVLDRWSALAAAFAPHLKLGRYQAIIDEAAIRVRQSEGILGRANELIDGSDHYSSAVVEACTLAFQALSTTFAEERKAAEQSAKLGPMLTDDYKQARSVFMQDLTAR